MTFLLTSTITFASTSLISSAWDLFSKSKDQNYLQYKLVNSSVYAVPYRTVPYRTVPYQNKVLVQQSFGATKFKPKRSFGTFNSVLVQQSRNQNRVDAGKNGVSVIDTTPSKNVICKLSFSDILKLIQKKERLYSYQQIQKNRNINTLSYLNGNLWYLNGKLSFFLREAEQNKNQAKLCFLSSKHNKVFLKWRFASVPLYYKSLFVNNKFYQLNDNQKLGCLYQTNLDKMSFLSSDLANLGLSLKTYTFLKQKNIHKIGNLVKYSSKSLLQLLNRDREMFAEVKRCFLLISISID